MTRLLPYATQTSLREISRCAPQIHLGLRPPEPTAEWRRAERPPVRQDWQHDTWVNSLVLRFCELMNGALCTVYCTGHELRPLTQVMSQLLVFGPLVSERLMIVLVEFSRSALRSFHPPSVSRRSMESTALYFHPIKNRGREDRGRCR
jgi:hypothetical protein